MCSELSTWLRENGATTNAYVSSRWTMESSTTEMHCDLRRNQRGSCICRWRRNNQCIESTMACRHLPQDQLRCKISTNLRRNSYHFANRHLSNGNFLFFQIVVSFLFTKCANFSIVSGTQVKVVHTIPKRIKLLLAKRTVIIPLTKNTNRNSCQLSTSSISTATTIWPITMLMTSHYWCLTSTLNSIHSLCQFVYHKTWSIMRKLCQLDGAASLLAGVSNRATANQVRFSKKSNFQSSVAKNVKRNLHRNSPIS